MSNPSENDRVKYLFLLSRPTAEASHEARRYLREVGVAVTEVHGTAGLVGRAHPRDAEASMETGLFSLVTRGRIGRQTMKRLADVSPELLDVARLWDYDFTPGYKRVRKDDSRDGLSWGDPEREPPGPDSLYDPRHFLELVLERSGLGLDEHLRKAAEEDIDDAFLKRIRTKRRDPELLPDLERLFTERYGDETVGYYLARIAFVLDFKFIRLLWAINAEVISDLFFEVACWKMEGEISVGVVFVESSRSGGPRFTASERNTLRSRIRDGLDWLADSAPGAAHLTWVYDWQNVSINVADENNSSEEDYWRNPAMEELTFNGNTYTGNWNGVIDYRDDLRITNLSAHAAVIFVTPFSTEWHAYASSGRITLADRNNWGGWGINGIDEITSHEMCHLFGATDEYTGNGTPCSSCGGSFGCYNIPNGNCGTCGRPTQNCIMGGNNRRLCAYTQGQIGWADLFVELETSDTSWAGTDDTVWLDIGDRTFVLDNPDHDDRERGNFEGYALNYTGVTRDEIKRVGIRKSSDGFAGGWRLQRVRLRHRGDLVCNSSLNQWLEDEYRWWASLTCGSSSTIVNRLRVKVATSNTFWAGTDDDVRLYLGGRSWDLDDPSHNDFERGHTDTFDLDPGTGLYESMLGTIRIYKSPDGIAGGWKLKGLEIITNGSTIFNKQNINKWMEDSDRNWYGSI